MLGINQIQFVYLSNSNNFKISLIFLKLLLRWVIMNSIALCFNNQKIIQFIQLELMFIKGFLLAICLTNILLAAEAPPARKNQIVDANHFYSEQNKQKLYTIQQLQKGKPLAVVLKPTGNQGYNNPLTLTLSSGTAKKQCKFKSFLDLCVLDSLPANQGSLNIKCQNLPCQAEWKIYQPPINKLENTENVLNLYELPKDTERLTINLFCKSVVEKQSNQRTSVAMVFSSVPFRQVQVSKQVMFIIFQQIKQGYVYFYVNPKYKACAKMKVSKDVKSISSTLVQDFLTQYKINKYSLPDIPDGKNFRFDISFHTPFAKLQKSVVISITGIKNGARSVIRQNRLQFNKTFKNYDLSYAVAKMNTSQWKDIQLEMVCQKNIILVEIVMPKSQKIQVEATQFSAFDLKKGEKLEYELLGQTNAQQNDTVKINLSDEKKIKSSQQKCKVKQGCAFQIQALEDVKGSIYIGVGKGNLKQALVYDFGSELSFTHKIRQLESLYIKKKLQLNKAVQVLINSPNVIVYAANSKKCQYPSQTCYQKLGNIHHHFFYIPSTQDQLEVYFLVKALDTCQFTLTLVPQDSNLMTLKDSQPFVYMFDNTQQKLNFIFTRKEKADVTFNLISPVGALDLIAENGKKIPDDEDAQISTQGFIKFKASQASKNQFVIQVRKRQAYKDKFVHFTLIGSTKGKMVRLESGITHYETLSKSKGNSVEYIFEFDPSQEFILNFYSHNTKQQQINIQLEMTALAENKVQGKQSTISGVAIDRSSDVLDLSQFSSKLCSQVDDDDTCQISIKLNNKMDRQVDIAITLMSHHTILQLKDGIWQSFSLNNIAKSSHFYFFPRNEDQDVGILYKTTDSSVRLKYRLFYSSDQQIDLSQWPFPSQAITSQLQALHKKTKPVNHISISKSALKNCWPNCVVLLSIIDLQHSDNDGSYSIMASNSIMEIPQKQKIDITLLADETKTYLIDLKYAMDIQQNIYLYVYHSIGLTSIYANVYSEKNDRVPDGQEFDFSLNSQKQIIIPFNQIKQIIKRQQMEEHNNFYLYIIVQALSDAKLSLQFAFKQIDEQNEKMLGLDSFQHLIMPESSKKIFYIPSDSEFKVKIVRQNGFPFFSHQVCDENKNKLEQCIDQLRQNIDKGQQILTKVAAYNASPCQKCYFLFKIATQQDPTEVTVHIQSKVSQIQLSENKAIYDFTQTSQQNRYVLYAIRGEQIFVNIHVTEGQVQAELTDLNKIQEKRTGRNIISFVISEESTMTEQQKFTPKKLSKQQKQLLKQQQKNMQSIELLKNQNQPLAQALMSAFGLSDRFVEVHVSVKSTDKQKPSIYTITYSSGEREFELQDGLITDYMLQPDKQATFYYSTRTPNHIYLTISMEKSSYLKDLTISMKYCQTKDGTIDDSCWVEYKIDSPSIKDKTPHPTLMYLLMSKRNLAITLTYKGQHSEKVSMGINHQQIMILPFDVQYPFILHKNQTIHFLVELSNEGYIEIITRKCDESNPIFSYTFDYEAFQKQQFTYEAELGTNPKSRFISKVKPGTLYMQIKTPENQQSMVSVFVHFSEDKKFQSQMLPGNKGDVEYTIVDSLNAQLKIKPPTCPDSHCPTKLKYYLMTYTNMRDLYSHLVCPSNFFSSVQFSQGEPAKEVQITPRQNPDGTLSIPFKLLDQISYVGVKVTNGKEKQIFYKPIEVTTLWGQLSRTSHTHKLTIGVIFICSMMGLIVYVYNKGKQGYKPIEDEPA